MSDLWHPPFEKDGNLDFEAGQFVQHHRGCRTEAETEAADHRGALHRKVHPSVSMWRILQKIIRLNFFLDFF